MNKEVNMNVNAVYYVSAIQTGWSKPLLFRCDDGNEYVVKLMNNPQGLRVLPNEMAACRVGALLGLPVGKCRVVHISKKLIQSSDALKVMQVKAGPHVGSRYYRDAKPLKEAEDLIGCDNLSEAAGMIAFDHWIQNWDRSDNASNILVVQEGTQKKIIMIDHANAFTGYWTIDSLKKNRTVSSAYWGSVYELFMPYIDSSRPFEEILHKINAVQKADLWATTAGLPIEWSISDIERHKLAKYLDFRRAAASDALLKLKDHFTQWK